MTGAVASQNVTEAPKGSLSANGNRAKSVKAEGSLTASQTRRAGTKVGLSDPVVPSGRAIAQRIKLPGDNRLISPRVHIDGEGLHLDVSSHHILGLGRSQGLGRSPIKVVRELGSERRETVRSISIVGVRDLKGLL